MNTREFDAAVLGNPPLPRSRSCANLGDLVGGGAETVSALLAAYFIEENGPASLRELSLALMDAGILLGPAGTHELWIVEDDVPHFRLLLRGPSRAADDLVANVVFERARAAVRFGLATIASGDSEPAFVRRAMFEGRVTRLRSRGGGQYWWPQVTEADAPSTWALALVTADLWNRADSYAEHLEACGVCGSVRFDAPTRESRCGAHRPQDPESIDDEWISREVRSVRWSDAQAAACCPVETSRASPSS